jgi:hypothetical protein
MKEGKGVVARCPAREKIGHKLRRSRPSGRIEGGAGPDSKAKGNEGKVRTRKDENLESIGEK